MQSGVKSSFPWKIFGTGSWGGTRVKISEGKSVKSKIPGHSSYRNSPTWSQFALSNNKNPPLFFSLSPSSLSFLASRFSFAPNFSFVAFSVFETLKANNEREKQPCHGTRLNRWQFDTVYASNKTFRIPKPEKYRRSRLDSFEIRVPFDRGPSRNFLFFFFLIESNPKPIYPRSINRSKFIETLKYILPSEFASSYLWDTINLYAYFARPPPPFPTHPR